MSPAITTFLRGFLREPLRHPWPWMWLMAATSLVVCGTIAWLHFEQRRVLEDSAAALEDLRSARVDLAKGFLHASLAGPAGSPYDREQGEALLLQATNAFEDAAHGVVEDSEDAGPGVPADSMAEMSRTFASDLLAFRAALNRWRREESPPVDQEAALRIAFSSLERSADRLDALIQERLARLGDRYTREFGMTLGGALVLMAGVCTAVILSIRLRREMERSMRESDERFRLLFHNSPDGILLATMEGTVLSANPAACKIFGLSEEEMKEASRGRLVDIEDPRWTALLEERTRMGMARGEGAGRRRDGSVFPAEVSTMEFVDKQGLRRACTVVRDITDRKRLELQLHESEERLRFALEGANDGVWDVNVQTGRVYLSPRDCEIIGYTPEEIHAAAIAWQDLVHPEDLPRTEKALTEYFEGRAPLFEVEQRLKTKSGALKWVLARGKATEWDGAGRPVRMIGTHTDIEKRRAAEEQVQASLKEKELLLKEIHHRVKNNMQVITSLLNLQSHRFDDPRAKELFADSQNRIKSMALIHEFLYQSKSFGAVNLLKYCQTLSHRLLVAYGSRNVALDVEGDEFSLGIDQAIPCGLVLNEMVSNALKHAFPDSRQGVLRVTMVSQNGRCRLEVRDDGVGLPEGARSSPPASLGMQLIASLTEQLGGSLDITVDGGTRFTLEFPIVAH